MIFIIHFAIIALRKRKASAKKARPQGRKEGNTMKLTKQQEQALILCAEKRLPMLRAELLKNSTGFVGKFAEEFRLILNKKPRDILNCRAANRVDVRLGRSVGIEIKTGCGAVAYAEGRLPFTTDDIIPENILPGVRFVLWLPFPSIFLQEIAKIENGLQAQKVLETMLKNSFLFTREQFLDMLESIGKNGLRSSVKVSKQGGQLNIQTISAKMESRLWDYLENIPNGYDALIG